MVSDDRTEEPGRDAGGRGLHWVFFGRDGLRAGWSLLLFAVLAYSLGQICFRALSPVLNAQRANIRSTHELPPGFSLLFDTTLFAVCAVAAFILAKVERRRFAAYGIGPFHPRRMRQFAAGLAVGVGTMSLLMLALKLAGAVTFAGLLLHGSAMARWGAFWAAAFLAVGFAEEYATRGFLQFTLARGLAGITRALGYRDALRTRVGFWVAAGFFSLLFGLGHGNNPGESPLGLLSAGLIGMVLAYSLWRTGSLWWAIGYHAAWDWTQSFVWGVADSGGVSQHRLLLTHPQGSVLMSGGLTGPEGSVLVLPVIVLTAAIVALTLKAETESPAAKSSSYE